jgi:hypothetical protein
MIPHRQLSKTDGSRCVDLFEVSECSDGMLPLIAPQNLNATNHMRQTEGGAFPLPSADDQTTTSSALPTDFERLPTARDEMQIMITPPQSTRAAPYQ